MNNDKELILAMVKFMNIVYQVVDGVVKVQPMNGVLRGFTVIYNPLTNGTQLNSIIEKMKLDILFNGQVWWCEPQKRGHFGESEDRTKSILVCIASILGVEYKP